VWIGILTLLLLLPGAGSAIIAATLRTDGGSRDPVHSSAEATLSPAPFPTPKPSRPGKEPPTDRAWPTEWPTFTATDPTRTIERPELGFSFQVPRTWDCTLGSRATDSVRYLCGQSAGGADRANGDLLVRACPTPCDANKRVQLRGFEEAWVAQWIRAGPFATWAETTVIDGAPRYGLVFIQFWRTAAEGPIDREVVFRVTAPRDQADTGRRVVNSIRDAVT
jgi:hypothetical protein